MPVLTTIDVTGMTCGHCVSAVTGELNEVDGVERVSVELVNGGTSHVTTFSDGELDPDALRAAVDEAGYDVVAISSHGAAEEFAALAEVRSQAYAGTDRAEGEPGTPTATVAEGGGVGPVGIALTDRPSGAPAPATGGCGCGCSDH